MARTTPEASNDTYRHGQRPSHDPEADSRLSRHRPWQRVSFEPLADGRVALERVAPKRKRKATGSIAKDDPLAKWVGAASGGVGTDALMRMSRGEDWNRP